MTKPIHFAIEQEDLERDGLGAVVQPWEDGLRIDTGRGSFEWWYFDAHFDDGSTAVIVYATKPIINPRTTLLPNLSLTITRPDGRKTAEFALPGAGAFSAEKEECSLRIGDSWVKQSVREGRWVYTLHAETATQSADLTFSGSVPPWRPGAGKCYFGDRRHFFAWLPAIPQGGAVGTLTYDGKARSVQGSGYHDHNWGNVALPAVMDHWTWGRATVGGYTLIFVEQVAARRYGSLRMPVFLLAKGQQVLEEDARCLRMETGGITEHPGGRRYPQQVDFLYDRSGEKVRLELRQPKLIEATSLLGVLPPWQRGVARWFANPYYFRFKAELDLVLELTQIKERVRGEAIYELMLLR